jgi:hypothetical protein
MKYISGILGLLFTFILMGCATDRFNDDQQVAIIKNGKPTGEYYTLHSWDRVGPMVNPDGKKQ